MPKHFHFPHQLLTILIACGSLGASCLMQEKLMNEMPTATESSAEASIFSSINLASGLDSFGYEGFSASILWMNFIQYYGGGESSATNYSFSGDYLETISNIEPRMIDPYLMANSALAFHSGEPERASELLERGMQHITPDWNPWAYRLPMRHAIVNFLYLGQPDTVRHSYNLAADWLEETQDASGDGLRELAERLYNNPDNPRSQFEVWELTFRITTDPEVKEHAFSKLAELGEVRRLPDGSVEIISPDEF